MKQNLLGDSLSMDHECEFSGLPEALCSHCTGAKLGDEPEPRTLEDDWAITRTFPSQYHGTCTIDRSHTIKRGEKVGKVIHTSNPFVPVTGVACLECIYEYPKAEEF